MRCGPRRPLVAILAAGVFFVTMPAGTDAQAHADKTPAARRVLWRDAGPIAARDLTWHSDREFKAPVPPYTFVKEETSGTVAKVRVTDASGREWSVKLAGNVDDTGEVHADVAGARLQWALGYFAEQSYFVGGGTISHVGTLRRASRGLTADGRFTAARFKLRPADADTKQTWTFRDNPFTGTRELSGLMILMTMENNWDLTPDNHAVLRARGADGEEELHYLVSDLGASFGHMRDIAFPKSMFSMHPLTKWDLPEYRRQRFLDGVKDGQLRLHFHGDRGLTSVPLDHARWFSSLASQLTAAQVRAAFEAAGGVPEEVDGFSARFLAKIAELKTAVGQK
jgi:hypothetical protein